MVFRVSDSELATSDSWRYILRRHISFFGEEHGFQGLLQWIGEENPFFERLITLAGSFNVAKPRKPFATWHFVDSQFRDLVCRMTVLDPARRITAAQALEHPWFAESDGEVVLSPRLRLFVTDRRRDQHSEGSFYAGGKAKHNSIFFHIDHAARKPQSEEARLRFIDRVDGIMRPVLGEKCMKWEFNIYDHPRDNWRITGMIPPMDHPEVLKQWIEKNEPVPY
ncbi:hypothetical protein VF21_02360 [Pseudogymnoascus sp. 05NY08]|nr:hypothetical protein VF21_02360 [Pseudogymnoascus sp. 05NY08]